MRSISLSLVRELPVKRHPEVVDYFPRLGLLHVCPGDDGGRGRVDEAAYGRERGRKDQGGAQGHAGEALKY